MGRCDGQMRGLAFTIRRLIQFERNPVGTHTLGFIRLGAPASIEPVAKRLVRITIEDFQPVASVLHGNNDLATTTGRNGDRRYLDQFLGFGKTGMPAALIIESPVIVPVLPEQPDLH